MLYDRWREIARRYSNELALHDLSSDKRWTFAQLADEVERGALLREEIVFPQGRTSEFVLKVLRAWRSGKIVCALEEDQAPPAFAQLPKNCAHLKTTSATTGEHRFVAFTAEQLAADAENIMTTMGLRRDWPNLGVISLAHSYGFSNLITPLLLHGIPLILVPSPLPEIIRRATGEAPFITLPAVPALWQTWLDAGVIPKNLRRAISAGAPLPLQLEQKIFETCGIKIHNFYGATECGGIAYDASETPRADGACVGTAMKNVALSIGEDGCLEVRSKAVGEAYWPDTGANLKDGIFQTSDLAEILDGKIFLRGRVSDQINVAGRKISPETIERALLKHPKILECLIFGVPSCNAERAEEIVAVVVSQECEKVLRTFASGALPAWQTPRHWWFVDALNTNSRGKVSRTEWRKRFLEKAKS